MKSTIATVRLVRVTGLFAGAALVIALFHALPMYNAYAGDSAENAASSPRTTDDRKAASMNEKVIRTDEEWKKILTPEQYRICRLKGTERAFTGKYHDAKTKGTYRCVACGLNLFRSDTKFESGTGWPSYWAPIDENSVLLEEDNGFFMRRVEALCRRCDSHLGHVFDDGPPPTSKRFCINSAALELVPDPEK